MKLKLFCTHLFLFALCFSCVFAQSAKKNEPYNVGEKLIYEATFSKAVFRGIAVADLNFSVERGGSIKHGSLHARNGAQRRLKQEARKIPFAPG